MKYTFDKNKISTEINVLKNIKATNTTRMDIAGLNNLLYPEKSIILLKNANKCYEVYLKLYEIIKKFYSLTYYEDEPKELWHFDNYDLTKEDILTIIYDFFQTRGKTIKDSCNEVFKRRKSNLELTPCKKVEDIEANTTHIQSFKESYIKCTYTGTINDVITLAHEYGHATMYNVSSNIADNNNAVIYREVDGVFLEQEIIDYLILNGICEKDVIKASIINDITMHESSKFLIKSYNIRELYYLISYMISIELSYQENKDNIFSNIISLNPKSPIKAIREINKLVNFNEHTDEYHLKLRKNAQKIGIFY